MQALAALAPAMAEVGVLVDVRLVKVDQPVPVALGAVEQRAQLALKGIPFRVVISLPALVDEQGVKWDWAGMARGVGAV